MEGYYLVLLTSRVWRH